MTAFTLPTRRSWIRRLADALHTWHRRRAGLEALARLDRRTLADIGIDASELHSIDAEAHAVAPRTRRRIVLALDGLC